MADTDSAVSKVISFFRQNLPDKIGDTCSKLI